MPHLPVVVIGAGPSGLTAAIDLAQNGVPVCVVEARDSSAVGSRAVCYARRTLEILNRLRFADPCVVKGVSWEVGRTFFRDNEVYRFNLSPDGAHQYPGMVNLQQNYLEEFAIARARALPLLDLRFGSRVTGLKLLSNGVQVEVSTSTRAYSLLADYVIAADGVRSLARDSLGLVSTGETFSDRFLIADIRMSAPFPAERWFWFDPPFHRGRSVLLHKQADDVWRVDFQLGSEASPDDERQPERVVPRIRAMLGDDRPFDLVWTSVYTFRCTRMPRFRHGPVFFIGDAAHQVSPFGARGANSGIQDADNLAWKLRFVLRGAAPDALLDTYDEERGLAADENIRQSTRSTDFIAPRCSGMHRLRDEVLALSKRFSFARALVNSGRLSEATRYPASSLNFTDSDAFDGYVSPGCAADDVPLQGAFGTEWLLNLLGSEFALVAFDDGTSQVRNLLVDARDKLVSSGIALRVAVVSATTDVRARTFVIADFADRDGLFQRRYDARSGSVYLFRPDQHLAARWRAPTVEDIEQALRVATASTPREGTCP